MLKVYVYGDKHQGFLDLPPNVSLDMETTSDLFDEDLNLGQISLPLDVPATEQNKLFFGFMEMLNNLPAKEKNYFRCDVWNDNDIEMLDAKITLLETDGDFNYERSSYSTSISGNRGLFGSMIAKKTLKDISWGKITFPEIHTGLVTIQLTSRDFATYVTKGVAAVNHFPYLRFAPAAILNFFDKDRPDYNSEFIAQDIVNNIVITGAGADEWQFGRPTTANNSAAAIPGVDEYVDHRTIPFFTYKWILQKLFIEFGYTVEGEWMDDAAWDDAVMFNNFAIEKYDITNFTDINREINITDHMPKKPIGVFLADIQKLFNVRLSFLTGRRIKIDYRKNSLKDKNVPDVTKLVSSKFKSYITDFKEKGFTLAFNVDTADSYFGDHVKEIDEKKLVASINKFTDFANLVIGRPFEYNDLVYVAAENQYYAYTNGVGPNAWDYYSEKLIDYKISSGDNKYETGIAPMATYILYNDGTGQLDNMDMVAADMKGSYYNKRLKLVENEFDTRIFFAKKILKNGVNVPSSFVQSRDRYNLQRVPKSLSWYGEDGLYVTCWKEWLDFLTNTRKIKTALSLNSKTYEEIKKASKLSIDGTTYLPYILYPKIPLRDQVEVELYRLS